MSRISLRRFFRKTLDYFFIISLSGLSIYIFCRIFDIGLKDFVKVTEPLRPLFYFLPSRAIYIILIPVLAIFSIFYSVIIARTKWGILKIFNRSKIETAESFLKKIYQSTAEYCLVLRPFGNDAFFSLNNIESEFYFDTVVKNWSKGIVIEQIIQKINNGKKLETVALVDPRLKFVPTTPKFISTSNETWQWIIFDLLKRSLFIFLIIPPGRKISDAVVWEVTKIMQLGLLGRFVILIPPQSFSSNKKTVAEIKEKLYFIADNLDEINDATYLIYPNEENDVDSYYNRWHELSVKERKTHMEILPISEYESSLVSVMKKMNRLVNHLSFDEKYLHASRDFSESDIEFSPEYIQLFLRKGKGPYQ